MSDAFGFDSSEYESVDDSGDLTPYDFQSLASKARYNALPDDIKECLAVLHNDHAELTPAKWDVWPGPIWDEEVSAAAALQLLDYFGAL